MFGSYHQRFHKLQIRQAPLRANLHHQCTFRCPRSSGCIRHSIVPPDCTLPDCTPPDCIRRCTVPGRSDSPPAMDSYNGGSWDKPGDLPRPEIDVPGLHRPAVHSRRPIQPQRSKPAKPEMRSLLELTGNFSRSLKVTVRSSQLCSFRCIPATDEVVEDLPVLQTCWCTAVKFRSDNYKNVLCLYTDTTPSLHSF